MPLIYSLVSVVVVSIISLIGVLAIALKKQTLEKIISVLVSFSTGALLGDAFLHLLPEAGEYYNSDLYPALLVFSGILLFFSLEKFLRWRHCHDINCHNHPKHLGTMNLVGDAVHNFIDGVLIAASYVVSIPLGISTTIAVTAHEIPQELGDFGVLLHSGFKKREAIIYNFASACFSILGAVLVLMLGVISKNIINFIIPLTAGGFIYIALSGLVPELHKEQNYKKSLIQLISIIVGIFVMYLLIVFE